MSDFPNFSGTEKSKITIGVSKFRERCRNTVQHFCLMRLVHFFHGLQVVQLVIAISNFWKTKTSEKLDKTRPHLERP